MHTTQYSFCGAVGANAHSCFKVDADARQVRRGIELTKVNSMRKTNLAIHHAVHNAVKEMLEVGGTSLAILLSRVSEISK